jgi:hypothetical protein
MKRFLILLSLLFCNVVFADTINLHWLNEDGTTYQDSTCVIDSDLILPATPPTKYGYTFTGWKFSNYTPIEYIESTGTQWIDTGVTMYANVRTNIIISLALTSNMSNTSIFGAQQGNARSILSFNGAVYCGDGSRRLYYSLSQNEKHQISVEYNSTNLTLYIDQEYQGETATYGQFASNTFSIFKLNGGDGVFIGKIYSFKYLINNILVRDFIPVLDKNGVPCLFDKVEAKFYYNQGTGQFIAGPVL